MPSLKNLIQELQINYQKMENERTGTAANNLLVGLSTLVKPVVNVDLRILSNKVHKFDLLLSESKDDVLDVQSISDKIHKLLTEDLEVMQSSKLNIGLKLLQLCTDAELNKKSLKEAYDAMKDLAKSYTKEFGFEATFAENARDFLVEKIELARKTAVKDYDIVVQILKNKQEEHLEEQNVLATLLKQKVQMQEQLAMLQDELLTLTDKHNHITQALAVVKVDREAVRVEIDTKYAALLAQEKQASEDLKRQIIALQKDNEEYLSDAHFIAAQKTISNLQEENAKLRVQLQNKNEKLVTFFVGPNSNHLGKDGKNQAKPRMG